MPHVELDSFRMYYEGAGEGFSGSPIVFLHGFSLDRRMWQPQVEAFRDTYHVITPDAIGHGLSDAPLTGYSRAHRVQDLAGLVDNLKIEKFHLVGLSMGGSTALGFALKHPKRLKSLVLASTGAAGYRISRRFDRLNTVARQKSVEEALAEWKRWSLVRYRGELEDLGRKIEEMMNGYSGVVWQDPMRGKYPEENDLSRVDQIKVPTLILAGAIDRVFAALAEKLHERIKSSRLTIYENTGHMLNLEQPERFNADLKVFLEGVARS